MMLIPGKYKIFISLLFLDISDSCKPSVQGETSFLRHILKHTLEEPLEFVWLRNTIPIATCRRNMACYDYSADGTITTLRSLGGGLFETILTFRNITKSDAGNVNLKYLGLASLRHSQPLFHCELQVYDISVLTLQDCLDIVVEGSNVQCLCDKKDDVSEDFELSWFDQNGKMQNNGSHLISFVATGNEKGYTCRGLRSDGVESKPLEYRPLISSRPVLVLKDKKSLRNVNIQYVLKCVLTDRLTYTCFTFMLVMMSLVIVTMYVCFQKEKKFNKFCSVCFKRLEKGKNMRSSFECLLLSQEEPKDCILIPYSPLKIRSLSYVEFE